MNSIKIAIIALLSLTATILYAESPARPKQVATDAHLTGHVVDATTGEHLSYITVAIKGTTFATMTDASGHFYLRNVPFGHHTVVATSIGYKAVEQQISITERKTLELHFLLQEESHTLNEVVISSNRNATRRREASTIVNVIAPLTLSTTASSSMADALNYQSGLRVEYNCGNCGVPQLRINGLDGQYSQILLDSRPVFSSLAAVYGLEQIPVEMVERIEVIRGGGSALFGSNAIGGVVNIITKEPLRNSISLNHRTQLIGGSATDLVTSLNATFVSDDYRSGVYLFGVIKDRQAYDHDADGFSEIPQLESNTIGFRAYHKFSRLSKLSAEYHHIGEFRRGGNLLDRPPHESDIAEQLNHNIHGGGLKYDYFSEDEHHRFSVYANAQSINRKSYFGTNQNIDAYGSTSDLTLITGTQYTFSMDRLLFLPAELTAGAEYNTNKLHDVMIGYDRDISQHVYTWSAFLQNEWKNQRWSFLLGARLDKHNLVANPIISPRATLRYSLRDWLAFRASYSSGFRAPQTYDEDLHVAAVGGEVALISMDEHLRPERSNSFNLSVDLYQKWGAWNFNFLTEGFFTSIKDVFSLVEKGHDSAGNLLLQRINSSGAMVAGVNFEAKLSYRDQFFLQGGYTLQRSLYDTPHAWSETVAAQRRMFRAPDLYGYLSASYSPVKPLSLSLTANHTGPMLVQHFAGYVPADTQTLTKDFADLSARVAYEFRLSKWLTMELEVGVKNILNSFQSDIDKGADRDSKYIYGPALPRTYYAGVKVKL